MTIAAKISDMQTAQTETIEHVEFYDDSRAIPLPSVQRAFDYFPYGSATRVMFGMLALTGCRIAELDRMRNSMIYGDIIHWHLGKKQRNVRRVRLPQWFLSELRYMRTQEHCPGDRLFPLTSETFRRYFTRNRHALAGEWLDRVLRYRNGRPVLDYRLQLNGLRKNYQTVRFHDKLREWKDPGVALEFTSKEMKHSSARITAYHYLQNFDRVGIKDGALPTLLLPEGQCNLGDWL